MFQYLKLDDIEEEIRINQLQIDQRNSLLAMLLNYTIDHSEEPNEDTMTNYTIDHSEDPNEDTTTNYTIDHSKESKESNEDATPNYTIDHSMKSKESKETHKKSLNDPSAENCEHLEQQ